MKKYTTNYDWRNFDVAINIAESVVEYLNKGEYEELDRAIFEEIDRAMIYTNDQWKLWNTIKHQVKQIFMKLSNY